MSEIPTRLSAALADRYRIERELGAGGMATVWLAQDLKHERSVAIKVLHPELAAVLGAERFLAEIKTTAKLQHPHILPLLDSGEADGLLFYVMPVVDGEALRAQLERETQLPLDDAVRIAREVASALDYAHRHGVIHRDIKPENILLHDGSALVADFGIALAVTAAGGARLTQTGLSLGTPQYMSPEQAMGEKAVDARSDVYSLGCVLYEMLAGVAPFTGPTAQAVVAKVITTEAVTVTAQRPTVPQHVAEAIRVALQKLPADRFASAEKFAEALEGKAGGPALARPRESARARATLLSRGGLALAAAGVIVGVAVTLLVNRPGGASDSSMPLQLSITLPDSAPMTLTREYYGSAVRSLDISRDGRTLVYASPTASGTRLIAYHLDRGTFAAIPGSENSVLPTLAPDGKSLVAVRADSDLVRLNFEDGKATHLTYVFDPLGIAWTKEDELFVTDLAGCVSSLSASSGAVRVKTAREKCGLFFSKGELAETSAGRGHLLLSQTGRLATFAPGSDSVRIVPDPTAPKGSAAKAGVRGSAPREVSSRYVVFSRDSALFAAEFDARSARLRGSPREVVAQVRRDETGGVQIALSESGTVAWAAGTDGSLARFVWVSRDGRVTDSVFVPPTRVGSYALSPDGKRLAFEDLRSDDSSTLAFADLDRGTLERVSTTIRHEPMDWIKGGTELMTLSRSEKSIGFATVRFPAGRPAIDTAAGDFSNESRDGSLRCGSSDTPGRIWRTSGARDTITLDEKRLTWCRFSPDGKFASWIGEGGALMVASTDPKGVHARARVVDAGADEPRWSPDSRQIYYRAATRWYVVPAPTADLKPAGPPKLLFRGFYLQAEASWDMGPDGRFLLLRGAQFTPAKHINVITNFPKFLEEKLRQAK